MGGGQLCRSALPISSADQFSRATAVTRARDLAFGPLLLAMMAQEILGLDVLDEVYD